MPDFSEFDSDSFEEEITTREGIPKEEPVMPSYSEKNTMGNQEGSNPITENIRATEIQDTENNPSLTTLGQQTINIPAGDNNQPVENNTMPSTSSQNPEVSKREEILKELTSSTIVARERYPGEIEELSKTREKILPEAQEKQQERQGQLDKIANDEAQIEEEKRRVEEEKKRVSEKLDRLKDKGKLGNLPEEEPKKKFLPFKEKKIERNKEKLQVLTETLKIMGSKLESIHSTKKTLEEDIKAKPELEPLRERFKELLPLFTTDLLSPEEKEIIFDPEFLSSLNTEEYLQIWRLGSPYYTSHVTRQGIYSDKKNDINPLGDEKKIIQENNFKEMIANEKSLKSTLSALFDITLSEEAKNTDPQAIIQKILSLAPREGTLDLYLGAMNETSEDNYTPMQKWEREVLNPIYSYFQESSILIENDTQADEWEREMLQTFKEQELYKNLRLARIYSVTSQFFNPNDIDTGTHVSHIVDKSAIHLASNEVLDDLYGAEAGNQIFVVYPTDLIASQYTFGTSDTISPDISQKPSKFSRIWNDIFVWTEDQSITLDAGIVFLPKNTQVDPETGSQYKVVDGKIIRAQESVSSKEYWEMYFKEHPEQKPKHVVYYDNRNSPTKSVELFLIEQGVVKIKPQLEDLGFSKNHVLRDTFDQENPRMKVLKSSSEGLLRKLYELIPAIVEEEYKDKPVTDGEILEFIRQINPYRNRDQSSST